MFGLLKLTAVPLMSPRSQDKIFQATMLLPQLNYTCHIAEHVTWFPPPWSSQQYIKTSHFLDMQKSFFLLFVFLLSYQKDPCAYFFRKLKTWKIVATLYSPILKFVTSRDFFPPIKKTKNVGQLLSSITFCYFLQWTIKHRKALT